MKQIFTHLIVLICLLFALNACKTDYSTNRDLDMELEIDKLTFMFYNTENLFDTINDPMTQDEEFTPQGDKVWDTDKYYTKLDRIAQVIDEIDRDDWPALIGLSEIENYRVLEDLTDNKRIEHAGYDIIHFNSPDERGIDLGILYRKSYMNILEADYIRLVFPFNQNIKTRDILYAKVEMIKGDVFHVYVNHWPSRREGAEETAPKRNYAAKVLKKHVDALLIEDPKAQIIIMGDFNDYPQDESIAEILDAGVDDDGLYNMAYKLDKKGKGTVNHKGDWGMIDQIIVSPYILEDEGWYTDEDAMKVFEEDWLLYKDPKWGDYKPDKTFGGDNYYGGYSDHLPIYITLKWED